MAWATKEQARQHWPDAVDLPDATLDVLLDVATEQCQAMASPVPEPRPTRYMLATVLQAREVYAAAQREGDVIGFGDYAIRARPVSAAVRQLLNPPRGYNTAVG